MTCKAEFDRLAAIVAATSLPRLVIWGAQDGINPRSPDRLARFGGELHVVADAGHLPHIESARVVNAILLAFLRRQIGG
jgi:pimeloyl-ACP methyl ester carboxylesterase